MAERHFRFAPRVLEHLGAELISSDDIALYELIKNGFDAKSARVRIDLRYQVSASHAHALEQLLASRPPSDKLTRKRRATLLRSLEKRVAGADKLEWATDLLADAATVREASEALDRLNAVVVTDTGVGMDADELDEYFLTIGTSHRFQQHRDHIEGGVPYEGNPPTGEKGIGRLSAMRLGRKLRIETCKKGEDEKHVLTIDWGLFSFDAGGEDATQVPVQLETVDRTPDDPPSGTTLTISGLNAEWDRERSKTICQGFLSKFIDPFSESPARKVTFYWNEEKLPVAKIGRDYLDASQNGMKGRLQFNKSGSFETLVSYWFTTKSKTRKELRRTYTAADLGGFTDAAMSEVGPFEFELYHYNRTRLAAIPGVATRIEFKEWLNEWCGGLKLYRDGVRVMPYGQVGMGSRTPRGREHRGTSTAYDDWLELDAAALRGQGFRVNRIQVVGCVRISRSKNPLLRDQANREGLIDSQATVDFVEFLKAMLRQFVQLMDVESRPKEEDEQSLANRSVDAHEEFELAVGELLAAVKANDPTRIRKARRSLNGARKDLRIVTDETHLALEDKASNRIEVLELASTGLAAESFAHDLEASLDHALTETAAVRKEAPGPLRDNLKHLAVTFKSLRTQIAAIKPGPARRRRKRSKLDVRRLVDEVLTYYESRFDRHNISSKVTGAKRGEFYINAVEGQLRQILDNLIRNSVYWLKESRDKLDNRGLRVSVTLDPDEESITVADNGPGIADEDLEWVFKRFTSRRKGGRGLGLYIARELSEFNGATLEVDTATRNKLGRSVGFIIRFADEE